MEIKNNAELLCIGEKMEQISAQPAKSNEETLEKVIQTIVDGRNVLLHGPGGVGKSWIIKHTAQRLKEIGYKVSVTATTGVAAVGISDTEMKIVATTLHRFAGIGTATLPTESLIAKVNGSNKSKAMWKKCEVLIIDEISMLGYDVFQKLCGVAKGVRSNFTTPMGGIQVIFSGDFLQLPPVKDDWIFKTPEWEELNFRPFVLEKPYRYEDLDFFQMLLRIRKGKPTPEDIKLLKQRVRANQSMQKLLETLKDKNPADVIRPTMFYSRRNDVDTYNQEKLDALPGDAVDFLCKDEIVPINKHIINTDEYYRMLDDDMPRVVSFKVGSQVMLRINLDPEAKLVNGSRGVVSEIVPNEALIVKFLNGQKLRVDIYKRVLEDKRASASRTQIPFILADAMTIHRAQGSTLDYCVAELGNCFCEGQAYVALSRCRSIKGLFLSSFSSSSIMVNKEALAYSELLEKKAKEEDNK